MLAWKVHFNNSYPLTCKILFLPYFVVYVIVMIKIHAKFIDYKVYLNLATIFKS